MNSTKNTMLGNGKKFIELVRKCVLPALAATATLTVMLQESAKAADLCNGGKVAPFTIRTYQPTPVYRNATTKSPQLGTVPAGRWYSANQWHRGDDGNSVYDRYRRASDDRFNFVPALNGWIPNALTAYDTPNSTASKPSYCNGQPAPVPQAPTGSTPRSVAEANRYFKLQINDGQWNPQGPSSSNNCGPASVAALIKLFGKEANGIGIQQSINNARYYMGVSQNANVLTNNLEMERGLRAVGLRTGSHMDDGSWGILDKDLNDGMAVIAWGWWGSQWRSQFPNYYSDKATDHFISIVGKTPNGNYLVLDPMYRGGAVEMSRARLAVFFSDGGGGHNGTPYFITVAR